jgi:hypothetical protein
MAMIITIIALILHIRLFLCAGPLWRDEVNSIAIATGNSFTYLWENMQYDSFPVLWNIIVRYWVNSGIGVTDIGMRILGLLAGTSFVIALWWNARRLFNGIPMISLPLVGISTAAICYGDTRAHGIGMLLGLISFSLIWSVTEAPSTMKVLISLIAAILSTHLHFYNCIFLLAACVGGMAVVYKRKNLKELGIILSIGIITAISMLIYVNSRKNWEELAKYDISIKWIGIKFAEAVGFAFGNGYDNVPNYWLWIILVIIGIVAAISSNQERFRHILTDKQHDLILYCMVALIVGVPSYVIFLLILRYYMQPWYFLILMVLVSVCLDGLIIPMTNNGRYRILRLVVTGLIVILTIKPVWLDAGLRKTNIDLIAKKIEQESIEGDLIMVSPWYYGVTFNRYYHGGFDWIVIPPISYKGFHRYDLIKNQMMSRDAIKPVEEKIKNTLQSGHRVWFVTNFSGFPNFPENYLPQPIPPAPESPAGWSEGFYIVNWNIQTCYYIYKNANKVIDETVMPSMKISHYEIAYLLLIEGLR